MENKYDLVIVGGGPGGMSAAIYASRRKLKTLVIAKALGGQMAMTNEIENYPGLDLIAGFDLSDKLKNQAAKFGAEFVYNEVNELVKNGEDFIVKTGKEEYHAKSVILAFGLTPRNLEVPGEKELIGKGVTYCATCDGPFYKGKTVAVVGGGNSALGSAIYLADVAEKVYLIHHSEKFIAEASMLELAKSKANLEIVSSAQVKEIKGGNKVEAIMLADPKDEAKELREYKVDGLFIEIGHQAKTEWLKGTVDLNARGEIMINRDCETSLLGVFAAGDCTDTQYKQIVTAAGDGAKAALRSYEYIARKAGSKMLPDWGKTK
jgi:thioredoxin reductase (NADPH)